MKERNANLDMIRVWSMTCVLLMHTPKNPWSAIPVFGWVVNCFIVASNSHFYMLSGQMNLAKTFSSKEDYREYYVKRLVSIVFPYLLVTMAMTLWNMVLDGQALGVKSYIKHMYMDLMVDNGTIHFWFMYPLIGMMLSAPFLSRMLHAIEDWELSVLMVIGLLWGVVSIYLTADIGVGFAYTGWFAAGWLLTFIAGYYCDRVIGAKARPYLYLAGFIGMVITTIGCAFFSEHFLFAMDWSPLYLIFVMAWYVFLKDAFVIRNQGIKRFLTFMTKHTFTIYLIHYGVIHNITLRLIDRWNLPYIYILSFLFSFGLSLAAAVLLDSFFIIPVQRWLRRCLLGSRSASREGGNRSAGKK